MMVRIFVQIRAVLLQEAAKKSPNQEIVLENRGRLKVLNDTKLVLNEHEWLFNLLGSIWYHLESSHVPYFQNQFLALDFFCSFLEQDGSNT